MVPDKHTASWHLLKQQYLWSRDTAWSTGRALESNSLKMNITNNPIYQVTPDICRQENRLVSQYWEEQAQKYIFNFKWKQT